MIDFLLVELNYWHWSCLGLVLLCIEMGIPGSFFIWIGCAALGTAAITYIFDFLFVSQMLSFALLSITCVGVGTRIYQSLEISKEAAILNRRADQMIGMTFKLSDAIVDSVGHTTVGDSRWRVIGKDLPAHTEVCVIEITGNSLVVEEIPSTPR